MIEFLGSSEVLAALAGYPIALVIFVLLMYREYRYAKMQDDMLKMRDDHASEVKELQAEHKADLRRQNDASTLNAISHAVRYSQPPTTPPGNTVIE